MNAETAILVESLKPRWRRRLAVMMRRSDWPRIVEVAAALALVLVLAGSYFLIARTGNPESPLAPEIVAALVVANLVPAMVLMIMVARRLAIRRAVNSDIGGRGRLHVRLVALFSIVASIPTLLVVIFASMLFQSGVKFWFSDQAQTVLTSAESVSQIYEREHRDRIDLDVRVMGADVVDRINRFGISSEGFRDDFLYQTAARQLTETAVLRIERGRVLSDVEVNFDNRPLTTRFPVNVLQSMRAGDIRTASTPNRIETVVRLDPQLPMYFYGARRISPDASAQLRQAQNAASAYQSALENTRRLQIRFNVVLIVGSLALIALSIGIALAIADRLVRPIGNLVEAARKVTAGDLGARVAISEARDEVGILGSTFNRMTTRLQEQTGALVAANTQLDSRRAFTEAVLSGVTAGVLSVDEKRVVQLINSQAEALLKTGGKSPVGQKLAKLAPELDRLLMSEEREDVVQLASSGEPRTLAVKTVQVRGGHVLTFDDITEQLLDQRRAAWSDVARRIAHEIKNPLTPIQLAAERLQRRYGTEVASDPATFEKLTGTIVRQVGDLRRMVDEFSSFARMPKPAFAEESLGEIARQALFLHEVAHPEIAFRLDAPDPAPSLVCDRRLLGQALTNIVKNGVEAIQQKHEEGKAKRSKRPDGVAITIRERGSRITIEVTDSGIGLPSERARMTEPYMTTRAKGTGLGLAIVKKIVEEHFGQIEFDDAPEGGSLVRLIFDSRTLAQLDGGLRYSENNNTSD